MGRGIFTYNGKEVTNEILTDIYNDTKRAIRVIPKDALERAKGNVPYEVQITFYAENEDFSNITQTVAPMEDKYSFQTSASLYDLVSSSNEDGVDGNGIQRVTIRGLYDDFTPFNDPVLTNGIAGRASNIEGYRINEVNVDYGGDNNGAVGNIDVQVGANILARITPLHNITTQGIFTVPLGTTLYIGEIQGSSGKADEGDMHLYVRNPVNNIPIAQFGTYFYQNNFNLNNQSYIVVPEKHDIEFTCIKTGSAGAARLKLWSSCVLVINEV